MDNKTEDIKNRRKWVREQLNNNVALKKQRTVAARYSKLKYYCKQRNFELDITKEDLARYLDIPCTYCGLPVESTGYGLDRIENTKGYLKSNVVPCCKICNQTKMDYFTYEEMMEIGKFLRGVIDKREIIHIVDKSLHYCNRKTIDTYKRERGG